MTFSELGPRAISEADFDLFVNTMLLRNHNLCIPPTEGGLLRNFIFVVCFVVFHKKTEHVALQLGFFEVLYRFSMVSLLERNAMQP